MTNSRDNKTSEAFRLNNNEEKQLYESQKMYESFVSVLPTIQSRKKSKRKFSCIYFLEYYSCRSQLQQEIGP